MSVEQDPEVRIVKRYANRKLYDTTSSQYVTLDDLAEMIRAGEDLRVIDNRSKEDLTSVTLAQIIFEQQKTRRRAMPLSALRTIIQGPVEIFGRLGQPMSQLRDEAAKQVERLKRPGEVWDEGRQMLIETVEGLQQSIEEMQHRVDERVRDAVDALTHVPNIKRELDEIKERLTRVESALGIVHVSKLPPLELEDVEES